MFWFAGLVGMGMESKTVRRWLSAPATAVAAASAAPVAAVALAAPACTASPVKLLFHGKEEEHQTMRSREAPFSSAAITFQAQFHGMPPDAFPDSSRPTGWSDRQEAILKSCTYVKSRTGTRPCIASQDGAHDICQSDKPSTFCHRVYPGRVVLTSLF